MPKVVDDSIGPIGSIVSSMLTLVQFQNLYGTGWVLMDGGSCTGSIYASVTGSSAVPDARGMVLRGKNNGRADGNQNPDGDSALGTFQNHAFASHNHDALYNISVGGTGFGTANASTTNVNRSDLIGSTGGNETRMRNITVNHFIRIN